MNRKSKTFFKSIVIAASIAAMPTIASGQTTAPQNHKTPSHNASHDHDHGAHQPSTAGPHGGTVQQVGQQRIETVIKDKGIMFMVLNQKDEPIATPHATGTLKLRIGDSDKTYTYQLKTLKNLAIGVGVDLSKVVDQPLHMDVTLNMGTQPIEFHTIGKLASGKLSDELLISLQGTCPVSGQPLGSMGKPPKVTLGDKSLFVCCAGCTKKVEANADAYIKQYYTASGEPMRAGVYKSTLADAAAIAAQKTCPVMDEPLGGMGVPGKVNVNGKAVYICCPGCAKKLAAEPDRYFAALKAKGVTPPAF